MKRVDSITNIIEEVSGGAVQTVVWDGKIHRPKNKPSFWYTAREKLGNKMEHVRFCTYGDFKTGEKHKIYETSDCSDNNSRNYLPIVTSICKVKEELESQLKAAKLYEWLLALYSPVFEPNDYLKRKQIDGFQDPTVKGRAGDIHIPTRDINGKIWGRQQITNDGKKIFAKGQRCNGLFHVIGKTDEGLICFVEGYATGVSVHMATGFMVVVCFSASGLVPVIQEFKQKYPKRKLLICGDEDYATETNPGRTQAERAADAAQCAVVFPHFEQLAGKQTTDFNDLHCREGLEAVKCQILAMASWRKRL